ncbi:uncharacterized protein JCM6883_000630 [Sporobolomyces salmoneus]|uniref:uncharacterized protein n=1 Tax=Sporobolomyces salmoneus TaxID=183962 RepID=UPI00317E3A6F
MHSSSHKLLVGGYDGQIHTIEFTPHSSSPSLRITSSQACGSAPTWLTLSEDKKTVYALDEWGQPGEVTAIAVDEIGQLTKLSSVTTGGLWPCHSTLLSRVTPPRLIVTNYKGASISSIPLHDSGDIDLTSSSFSRIDLLGTGTPGPHTERQQQDHPHGAHLDPKQTVLVVPDLGTDDLRIYGITSFGDFEELEPIKLSPGSGPRHVLLSQHDGGQRLYVMNELSNSVSVFSVEYPSVLSKTLSTTSASSYPTFTLLQETISLLPPKPFPHQTDFSSWHSAELQLSPSGRTLYASNRAEGHNPLHPPQSTSSDLLAIFPLDLEGTLIESERNLFEIDGRCPRHFALSEQDEGRWIVVSCHDSDEVIVFERKGEDGRELEECARLKGCGKPAVAVWL